MEGYVLRRKGIRYISRYKVYPEEGRYKVCFIRLKV
jgi:hypothetical protein